MSRKIVLIIMLMFLTILSSCQYVRMWQNEADTCFASYSLQTSSCDLEKCLYLKSVDYNRDIRYNVQIMYLECLLKQSNVSTVEAYTINT